MNWDVHVISTTLTFLVAISLSLSVFRVCCKKKYIFWAEHHQKDLIKISMNWASKHVLSDLLAASWFQLNSLLCYVQSCDSEKTLSVVNLQHIIPEDHLPLIWQYQHP